MTPSPYIPNLERSEDKTVDEEMGLSTSEESDFEFESSDEEVYPPEGVLFSKQEKSHMQMMYLK